MGINWFQFQFHVDIFDRDNVYSLRRDPEQTLQPPPLLACLHGVSRSWLPRRPVLQSSRLYNNTGRLRRFLYTASPRHVRPMTITISIEINNAYHSHRSLQNGLCCTSLLNSQDVSIRHQPQNTCIIDSQ